MSSKRRKDPGELVVHIGAGFAAKERPHVRDVMSSLRPHLGRWNANDISVEVSLQDRGRREQRVTLRTSLPGLPPLVVSAADADLTHALQHAKHELIRRLEQQKATREPMHSHRLSGQTIRHPSGPQPFGRG